MQMAGPPRPGGWRRCGARPPACWRQAVSWPGPGALRSAPAVHATGPGPRRRGLALRACGVHPVRLTLMHTGGLAMTSTPEVSCPDTQGYRPQQYADTHLTDAARLVRSSSARTERPGRIRTARSGGAADMAALLCEANQQARTARADSGRATLDEDVVSGLVAATGHWPVGVHRQLLPADPHRRRRRPPVTPVPRLRGHDPAVRHQPGTVEFTNQAEGPSAPSKYKCAAQAAAGGRCKG